MLAKGLRILTYAPPALLFPSIRVYCQVNIDGQCDDYVKVKLKEAFSIRGLKIAHLNVCSLLPKIDHLKVLLSKLLLPHILAICETWLNSSVADCEVSIKDYQFFRKDRNGNGGGVGVYVHQNISVTRLEDSERIGIRGLWLNILVPKTRGFHVGCFYHPPDSSKYNNPEFMNEFNEVLDVVSSEEKKIIILGNFNCDLLKHPGKFTPSVTKCFKALLQMWNFSVCVDKPTRASDISSSLIDIIATTGSDNIASTGNVPVGISDRYLVYCVRKLNCGKGSPSINTFRNFPRYNPEIFCDQLKDIDWNSTMGSNNDVENQWLGFKDEFTKVIDEIAAILTKRLRGIGNPWMNSRIKDLMYERDYYLKIARRDKLPEYWCRYRSLRNQVTLRVRQAKSKYNRKLIEDNRNDPIAFWKSLKRVFPYKQKSDMSKSFNLDGSTVSDPLRIVNGFNSKFVSVVSKLSTEFQNIFSAIGYIASTIYDASILSNTVDNGAKFEFRMITIELGKYQLLHLKARKSMGIDFIPARLLKDGAEYISEPLVCILNNPFQQGRVPTMWKIAKVVPLYKCGSKLNTDNYRPMSILPIFSKILERAVYNDLNLVLTENNLLSPYQYGFRRGYSTELANICLSDTIRQCTDF